MKPLIIVVPKLRVYGMAVWPFILVQHKSAVEDNVLINHERIHLRQQAEMLVLPFYLIYLISYVINRARYNGHDNAYRNIFFEREAYQNERDADYLRKRKWFAWRAYL